MKVSKPAIMQKLHVFSVLYFVYCNSSRPRSQLFQAQNMKCQTHPVALIFIGFL
jgi:hypothetical protein